MFRVVSVSSCQFRTFENRKQLEPEQTEMEKDQSVTLPAPAVPKAAATEQQDDHQDNKDSFCRHA
jgi:hypothetical protein